MWRVIVPRGEEAQQDAVLAEVTGRPVDREALGRLFTIAGQRGAPIPGTLRSEAELGDGWRASSLYSIDVWGPLAAEATDGFWDAEQGVLAALAEEEGGAPQIAWHDRTVMLAAVDGDGIVMIDYWPDGEEWERDDRIRELSGGRWPLRGERPEGWPDERILDWRLYIGDETMSGWGQSRFRRVKGALRAVVKIPNWAAQRGAKLVGKAVRVEGPPGGSLASDHRWEHRLAGDESALHTVAAKFPRLIKGGASAPSGAVTVYVHGTLATTLPALQILEAAGCLNEPTYRYEHDTFRGLAVSAGELAGLIEEWFPPGAGGWPRVRLIAHSRGGLVARWASDILREGTAGARTVEVITLGTPHRGTPIIGEALSRLAPPLGMWNRVNGMLAMDTLTDSGGVPITDPVTLMSQYMFRGASLPEGIRSMAPGSDALAALKRFPGAQVFTAAGGEYDLAATPPGFLLALRTGFADGVFAGEPNDLVVALASSAVGTDTVTVQCAHSAYFHQPEVQDRIR